jgi:hypothetical protein
MICYHVGVVVDYLMANGDDGLTWADILEEAYKRAAEELGFMLRDVKFSKPTNFDFCSHNFKNNGASLQSWPKAMYGILCKPGIAEADMMQIYGEMRHNSGLNEKLLSFILSIRDELVN